MTWAASLGGPTGYKINLGTTTGGTDILNAEDVGNVTTYDLASDLSYSTTYYCTITAYNLDGDATGCTEESFTTETIATIPNCTTLTLPLNGATDVSITTYFSWTAIANADGYF